MTQVAVLAALLREALDSPNDHLRIRDEHWLAEWLIARGVSLQLHGDAIHGAELRGAINLYLGLPLHTKHDS